tara:strand:+ start:1934 stop:2263 length:330 start_codon:yes stop_codon:yes gene_type:complete
MKTLGFQRHKYSGELYKFVREVVGDTESLNYYFSGNVSLSAGIDINGKLIIRADQPLAIGSLVANIKDASGNLILDDIVWQISSLQPVLNSFSTIEHYTMKTVKYQGTL